MKVENSICPIMVAAAAIAGITDTRFYSCSPRQCMWAMRKTAKNENGEWRTVGYRCAIANGSDRYVEVRSHEDN